MNTKLNTDGTPKEQVNQLVEYAIDARNKTGKIAFPDGTDPMAVEAARNAVIARDFQKAQNKTSQELAKERADKEALTQAPPLKISDADQARLDKLMVEDPEKYYTERNRIEAEAELARQERIKTLSSESLTKQETLRREATLKLYQQANPNLDMSIENLVKHVPPILFDKLDSGEITFEQMLDEGKLRLANGTVIGKTEVMGDPNLSKAGGSDTPNGRPAPTTNEDDDVF